MAQYNVCVYQVGGSGQPPNPNTDASIISVIQDGYGSGNDWALQSVNSVFSLPQVQSEIILIVQAWLLNLIEHSGSMRLLEGSSNTRTLQ
jgi:hypothetical protein